MCSIYVNHSRLNCQDNWGGHIGPFNVYENLYFDNDKDIYISSKNYEEMTMATTWFCQSSRTNTGLHILQDVAAELNAHLP